MTEITPIKNQTLAIENRDRNTLDYWQELSKYWYGEYQNEKQQRQIAEQEAIAAQGMLNEYTVAYNGMERKREEAEKLAHQRVNSDYAACTEIDDVVKDRKVPFNFKLTFAAAGLIAFLVLVWQYGSNPTFKSGIDANFPAIAIIFVAIAFIGFLFWNQKKK